MSVITSPPFGNIIVICKKTFLDIVILVLIKHSCRFPPLDASASREPTSLSGEFREETSTSAAVNVAELDVLYRDLPTRVYW